jgi:endonuclease III-like uncharacterized protein
MNTREGWLRVGGLATEFSYDHLKKLFEKDLPTDAKLFQDFHALIIIDQKGEEKSGMRKI